MIISLILYACNVNTNKILQKSLSYIEKHKLFGQTEDFKVVITVGIKEVVPIIDGIKGETEEFTKIELIPLKLGGLEKTYCFEYGNQRGQMSPDSIRYQQGVTFGGNIIYDTVTIIADDVPGELALTDINDSTTTYQEALEISSRALKDMLKESIKRNTLQREIYISIVEDTYGANRFYYYIGYLGSESVYSAALIDPYAKKAVAVRM